MKIGYARVSTDEQNLRLQVDALKAAGAEKIYKDRGVSGGAVIKPELRRALAEVREGDELIVWKLDRLSRSLKELIEITEAFGKRGLGFRSLQEQIETVSPAGRLFFHIIGALAEFEREMTRERTNAGLRAARRAGKQLGRPPKVSEDQWRKAKDLMASDPEQWTPSAVGQLLGISRQAVHKRLRKEAQESSASSES